MLTYSSYPLLVLTLPRLASVSSLLLCYAFVVLVKADRRIFCRRQRLAGGRRGRAYFAAELLNRFDCHKRLVLCGRRATTSIHSEMRIFCALFLAAFATAQYGSVTSSGDEQQTASTTTDQKSFRTR